MYLFLNSSIQKYKLKWVSPIIYFPLILLFMCPLHACVCGHMSINVGTCLCGHMLMYRETDTERKKHSLNFIANVIKSDTEILRQLKDGSL